MGRDKIGLNENQETMGQFSLCTRSEEEAKQQQRRCLIFELMTTSRGSEAVEEDSMELS